MYPEVERVTKNIKEKDINMFVQSKGTTNAKHVNGLAIEQRRGNRETLVQWSNGDCRWVPTSELAGEVKLIGSNNREDLFNGQ